MRIVRLAQPTAAAARRVGLSSRGIRMVTTRRPTDRRLWTGLIAAGLYLGLASPAPAQNVARKDGLYINVPNALKDRDVDKIPDRIEDAVKNRKEERKGPDTIIFDFNPNGLPNSTSEFGACNSLRKLIGKLRS